MRLNAWPSLIPRFFAKGFPQQKRIVEALFDLTVACFLIRLIPFRRWSATLGIPKFETPYADQAGFHAEIAAVQSAVDGVQRYLPWHSTCLMNAVAAKRMLRRRNIASTLYLGVVTNTSSAGMTMNSHAWLRSGSVIVTGALGHEQFAVISTFGS